MRPLSRLFVSCATALLLAGCAAMPRGSVIFTHTPLLPAGTIHASAALEVLRDVRPDEEQRALKTIPHIDEQVTALLLQDLTHVNLFDSVVLANEGVRPDILLRGEIRSLTWDSKWNPITFVPYLNIITLLGFPAGRNQGSVKLYVEAVDAKSGEVLARHEKSSGSSRTFSIYQTECRTAGGEETREALRIVFDELKQALWADRERLASRPAS